MGPSGFLKPPSFALCVGFMIFLCILFMSAEGLSQGDDCLVEKCTIEYRKRLLDLDATDQQDSPAICDALRTYRHCINRTVGCHGNIFYYTVRNYVRQEMETKNCTTNGNIVEQSDSSSSGAVGTSSRPRQHIVPAVCLYPGKATFMHCGLFGDPHLRTFYDVFQTCRVKGAWPLVNNDYLTVQVTNDAVHGNTDATATSKLTVIVKGNPECTSPDFQTYQAQTNSLPGTFDDGRVTVGPYDSLELLEVDPGRHVEIHIRYINTVVVVRQIGRYFTFSIRMPEDLVNQSSLSQDLQLCVRGCPQAELINYQEYLATRKYSPSSQDLPNAQLGLESLPAITRSEAEKVCREAKLVDFYFDSCVFDLMATGDQNFTLSAMSSLMDVLKLHPSAARTMANRTSLDTYDRGDARSQGGVWRTRTSFQIVFLLMLTLLVSVISSR